MTKRNDGSRGRRGRVGEPIQVYLARPDRERLERLATELGMTRSDILRRGLAALEALTRTEGRVEAGARPALPTFAGGALLPGADLDDSAALLDLMERDDAPR